MEIIFAGVVNTGVTGECVLSTTRAFLKNSTFPKSVLGIVETRSESQVEGACREGI
jgi:hypothetical protein